MAHIKKKKKILKKNINLEYFLVLGELWHMQPFL